MAGKLTFLVGLGAGYVLGARSGRERYEQIAAKAQELWNDPRVQEKAGQAQQIVQDKAGHAGQAVKKKVSDNVSADNAGTDSAGSGNGSAAASSPAAMSATAASSAASSPTQSVNSGGSAGSRKRTGGGQGS